jgi:prepilin-type N-terminal cleavage/methylation domain-containing protein
LFRSLLKEERGYSLIEVIVSIMILAIAILPMVSMFDMGLNSATKGSNYDKARALANLKLEEAKSLPYETVRTNFPSEALSNNGAPDSGSITSSLVTNAEDPQVPQGFSYTVTKQYLLQPPLTPDSNSKPFQVSLSDADTKLLKVTVTVSWASGTNTYRIFGLVTG